MPVKTFTYSDPNGTGGSRKQGGCVCVCVCVGGGVIVFEKNSQFIFTIYVYGINKAMYGEN